MHLCSKYIYIYVKKKYSLFKERICKCVCKIFNFGNINVLKNLDYITESILKKMPEHLNCPILSICTVYCVLSKQIFCLGGTPIS